MSDTDDEMVQDILKRQKRKGKNSVFVIFLLIAIIFGTGGFLYYQNIFPKQLMNSGKKYLTIKQYDKAMRIFKYMERKHPKEEEPLYYEVLTLAKMAPVYENQKRLYEISQFDDCDKASKLALDVLRNIRKQIALQAGVNFIDNVFTDELILRWNNNQPITYAVTSETDISSEFLAITDKAFKKWQMAVNNDIVFKQNMISANIVIHITDKLPEDKTYSLKQASAVTVPTVTGNKLNRMDIYINIKDKNGNTFSNDKLYSVLLHEIGHALGLGAHSASEYDIMNMEGDLIQNKVQPQEISLRDLNTLMFLYKLIPDAINENLTETAKNNLLYHPIITMATGENFEAETQKLIEELKSDGKNLVKWIDLANNYAIRRQYVRSNYILERLLPFAGDNRQKKFSICYNMALNYYKMKNYPLAEKYLEMSEQISKNKKTRILNSFIDVKKGNLDLAERKLLYLREKYPDNISVSVKLAEVYHKEKKYKLSRQIIKDLITVNPKAIEDSTVLKYKK